MPQHTVEILPTGEVVYWVSYHQLREWLIEQEIKAIILNRSQYQIERDSRNQYRGNH